MRKLLLALGVLLAVGSALGAELRARRPGTILFKLKPNASTASRASLLAALRSLHSQSAMGPGQKALLLQDSRLQVCVCSANHGAEEKACDRLMASGAVQFAQPDYVVAPCQVVPNDPGFGYEWWQWDIDAPHAWEQTTGNRSVLVAVCDTGFDLHHPDLSPNFVLPGYNVVDGSEDVTPLYSHGTCVAGLIGAAGNNGVGVAGVAWQVSLLPIKISSPLLTGGRAFVSDIVAGIVYAANRGAQIVNLSFDAAGLGPINEAADYLRGRGGLLIVSAGNEDVDPGYTDYPGFLAIGATGSGMLQDLHLPSNYGTFVDMVAPGDLLYTTGDAEPYTYFAGTSASAAVVSGVASLVAALNPRFTPANIETVIRQSCLDIGPPGEDAVYGRGRISASAAIDMTAGDLNRDGAVNQADYLAFRASLGSSLDQPTYNPLADYDGDGRVSYSDYTIWYQCYRARL
ncbi:MAG: S8 family serine peptidase [Verrucomicrobiota bacterium]